MTGCRRASRRSSAASAVAQAGGLALVQPRLDGLRVPVAEVVEREVVEHVRRGREVECRSTLPRPAPARASIRARIQRSSSAVGSTAGSMPSAFCRIRRETFQSLFASLRPSSIAPGREPHVLRRRDLEQAVARRVRAVRVDHLERVDAVAEALRHPPSVGREHRRMDDHVGEREPRPSARARPRSSGSPRAG